MEALADQMGISKTQLFRRAVNSFGRKEASQPLAQTSVVEAARVVATSEASLAANSHPLVRRITEEGMEVDTGNGRSLKIRNLVQLLDFVNSHVLIEK